MRRRALLMGGNIGKSSLFIARFDTTKTMTGSGDNKTIVIPFTFITNDVIIDFGDGIIENHTTSASVTHTYMTPGIYNVKIRPKPGAINDFFMFNFYNNPDRLKLIEVLSWGKFRLIANSFRGCVNLTLNNAEGVLAPYSGGATALPGSFFGTTNIFEIKGIQSMDISSQTQVNEMFRNSGFNQDISMLDWSGITNMNNFMTGKTPLDYNAEYYDALLIALDLAGNTNVTLGMGTIRYTAAGSTARANLVSKGWIITDGGLAP